MNKMLVCKNCGTEYMFGGKRKMPTQIKIVYWSFFMLLGVFFSVAAIYSTYFFIVPRFPLFFDAPSTVLGILCLLCLFVISLCMIHKYRCPSCGGAQSVPSDSPLGAKLRKESQIKE